MKKIIINIISFVMWIISYVAIKQILINLSIILMLPFLYFQQNKIIQIVYLTVLICIFILIEIFIGYYSKSILKDISSRLIIAAIITIIISLMILIKTDCENLCEFEDNSLVMFYFFEGIFNTIGVVLFDYKNKKV